MFKSFFPTLLLTFVSLTYGQYSDFDICDLDDNVEVTKQQNNICDPGTYYVVSTNGSSTNHCVLNVNCTTNSTNSTNSTNTTNDEETLVTYDTTTGDPTTGVPTTGVPTTSVPTTGVPTTSVPTTNVPTTNAPTTGAPLTVTPITNTQPTNVPIMDDFLSNVTLTMVQTHGPETLNDGNVSNKNQTMHNDTQKLTVTLTMALNLTEQNNTVSSGSNRLTIIWFAFSFVLLNYIR